MTWLLPLQVDVIVGFSNGGEEAYNVSAIQGSLHSAAQWNLWVQNFTLAVRPYAIVFRTTGICGSAAHCVRRCSRSCGTTHSCAVLSCAPHRACSSKPHVM